MKKTMLPALAVLTLLTACGGGDEPPPPADNGEELLDVTNEAMTVPEAPPPSAINIEEPANVVAEDTPEPTPPDQQVQEDADATGMTARVDRGAATEEPAQPVEAEVSEEKKQ